jgi:hypothetical protein
MSYLVESTPNTDVYDGGMYSFKVIYSNRWGNRIEIFCALSDRNPFFAVPGNRFDSTLAQLRGGADPDKLAKEFPID